MVSCGPAPRRAPRRRRSIAIAAVVLAILGLCGCDEIKIEKAPPQTTASDDATAVAVDHAPETMLQNIVQLTTGGTNRQPAFSVSGERIIWLGRPAGQHFFQVWSMNAEGDGRRIELAIDGRCLGPDFAPDGSGFVVSCTQAVTPPAAGTTPDDAPVPGVADWLYDAAFDIYLVQRATGRITPLVDDPGYDAEASFSWDGRRIVYSSMADGEGSLWLMDSEGQARRRLLDWPGYIGGAQLSPGGDRIVFQAAPRDSSMGLDLYTCASDGSDVRLLTDAFPWQFTPAWHPSGDFIIYAGDETGIQTDLFIIGADGGNRKQVTFNPGRDGCPTFSRDGRYVVWSASLRQESGSNSDIFRATWRRN